jgi:hypothetical protein
VLQTAYTQCIDANDWECVSKALKNISTLYGIGPATASAVLSVKYESVPFMSDESVMFSLKIAKKQIKYSMGEYKLVYAALNSIADTLNGYDNEDVFKWSARKVDRAIWSSMKIEALGGDKSTLDVSVTAAKRKAVAEPKEGDELEGVKPKKSKR